MRVTRLIRAELRKLTTTRMPIAFVAVLVAISATTAIAVIFGTDFDGSKGFISTADDLFGAIAVAREYGHGTVVPTYLAAPRRGRAVVAQLAAVLVGGAVLGLIGAGLTVAAVAAALPTTEFGFLLSAGAVAQLVAASAFAGAAGAVLGAGIGAVIRNPGGAVTGAVVVLVILPPLVVQLANATASWVPTTLAGAASGVAGDVGVLAALGALAAWAIIPAAVGLASVQRRDIV